MHKPKDTLATDNVLQINLGKKKIVKEVKTKDLKAPLMGQMPNYLLEHQAEDSAGEIETQLIKGEVLKTRGGGTSVQFTDIETLKRRLQSGSANTLPKNETPETPQKTPRNSQGQKTPRNSQGTKRQSEDNKENEDNIADWTDVETRCAVGIEGRVNCDPATKKQKH